MKLSQKISWLNLMTEFEISEISIISYHIFSFPLDFVTQNERDWELSKWKWKRIFKSVETYLRLTAWPEGRKWENKKKVHVTMMSVMILLNLCWIRLCDVVVVVIYFWCLVLISIAACSVFKCWSYPNISNSRRLQNEIGFQIDWVVSFDFDFIEILSQQINDENFLWVR